MTALSKTMKPSCGLAAYDFGLKTQSSIEWPDPPKEGESQTGKKRKSLTIQRLGNTL